MLSLAPLFEWLPWAKKEEDWLRRSLRWGAANNNKCALRAFFILCQSLSSRKRLDDLAIKWKCHQIGGTHLLWRRRRDWLSRSLRWGAVQSKWVRPAGFFHFMSIPFKPEKAWRSRHKMKMPPKRWHSFTLAEEEGFEPPKAFTPCRFSRPVQSTALPLLRVLFVCERRANI